MIASFSSFNTQTDTPSGPAALCGLMLLGSLFTPLASIFIMGITGWWLGPRFGGGVSGSVVKTEWNTSFNTVPLHISYFWLVGLCSSGRLLLFLLLGCWCSSKTSYFLYLWSYLLADLILISCLQCTSSSSALIFVEFLF